MDSTNQKASKKYSSKHEMDSSPKSQNIKVVDPHSSRSKETKSLRQSNLIVTLVDC